MDELAQVLQCCGSKLRYVIQEPVIEHLANKLDLLSHAAQVLHHPGVRVSIAEQGDFGVVGVAVNAPATRSIDLAVEGMRGFEEELLAQLVDHRMPTILWICTLGRHCGCARQ